MGADLLERLAGIAKRQEVDAGVGLFREGAPADTVYFVIWGRVALSIHVPAAPASRWAWSPSACACYGAGSERVSITYAPSSDGATAVMPLRTAASARRSSSAPG